MSQHRRLGEDAAWLLLARLGTQGLMVLFTLLIARRLGEAGMGQYAFLAAAIFLSNVLTTFGTDMLLIHDIASGGGLARLPAVLVLQLGLSALFVGLTFAGAPLLPGQSGEAVLALQVYSLALFPLAFYTVCTSTLRGRQRMDLYTLLNLAVSVIQVLVAWRFVQPGISIVVVAGLLLGVQLAAALIAGLICAVYVPESRGAWRFTAGALPALVRASAPIALLGLLGIAYQKLSIYMLATLSGAAMTGWFSASLSVVEASKTGHLALFGALYPAMARARGGAGGDAHLDSALTFSWKLLMTAAAAAALALFFTASPLVALLYGPSFGPSGPALRILCWTIVPYTINTYLSLAFVASGRERAVAYALLASLIALAALTAWWLPGGGLAGACAAALAAEAVQSVVLLVFRIRDPIRFSLAHKPERAP